MADLRGLFTLPPGADFAAETVAGLIARMARRPPEAMARVIEGLITGVGFIGGGAIIKHGEAVRGTATAASLWATGAIGASVGLGQYDLAIAMSAFTVLTLRLVAPFKAKDDPQ